MGKRNKRYQNRVYPNLVYPDIKTNQLLLDAEKKVLLIKDNKPEIDNILDTQDKSKISFSDAGETFAFMIKSVLSKALIDIKQVNQQMYVGFSNPIALQRESERLIFFYRLNYHQTNDSSILMKNLFFIYDIILDYFIKRIYDTHRIKSANSIYDIINIRDDMNKEFKKIDQYIKFDYIQNIIFFLTVMKLENIDKSMIEEYSFLFNKLNM